MVHVRLKQLVAIAVLGLISLMCFQSPAVKFLFSSHGVRDDVLPAKMLWTSKSPLHTSFEGTSRKMPIINIKQDEIRNFHTLSKIRAIGNVTPKVSVDTKIILWYIPTRYTPKLSSLHQLRGCPEMKCRITTNRDFYNQSDAVLFTAQLITDNFPPKKISNQVWILHNHESPQLWAKNSKMYNKNWKSLFNWTMSYRDDSDVLGPYGIFKTDRNGAFFKKEPRSLAAYADILSQKTKTVAWMVSNCGGSSNRIAYVNELKKDVDVDIFGLCGSHKCPRGTDERCLNTIATKYKFYLSFENAFCKDYITEKFFRFFLSNIILIVRGGGNYSRIAPPGTYINTADYESPKALAKYINWLDKHDDEYLKLVREKDKYTVLFEPWPIAKKGQITYMTYHYEVNSMCEICHKLRRATYRKAYRDIRTWFKKGICYKPKDIVW